MDTGKLSEMKYGPFWHERTEPSNSASLKLTPLPAGNDPLPGVVAQRGLGVG